MRILVRWRDALAAAGRPADIQADIARIRETHRRRPTLLRLLNEAGLRDP